jgi:transcriptional regulator with XRE-family HTH domain
MGVLESDMIERFIPLDHGDGNAYSGSIVCPHPRFSGTRISFWISAAIACLFYWVTIHRVRCPIGPWFTEKTGYPASPKAIGEMIRKRRLDLGSRQKDGVKIIGCNTGTVTNWEKTHIEFLQINHMVGVVRFRGFNPLLRGSNIAGKLANFRTARGMTQKAFAEKFAVDQSTFARWELGMRFPAVLKCTQ